MALTNSEKDRFMQQYAFSFGGTNMESHCVDSENPAELCIVKPPWSLHCSVFPPQLLSSIFFGFEQSSSAVVSLFHRGEFGKCH